jgi:hypothetical protein
MNCTICDSKIDGDPRRKTCSKDCFNAHHRARAKNNRKNKKISYLLMNARARAKKAGLPFDVTEDDLLVPTHCPALGLDLSVHPLSIDKIIPSLGYVKGNVQVLSMKANRMKQDASPEELKRFAEWVNNDR